LLTRTTRQLSLTADGQAFLQRAEQGLSKIYEAIDLFGDRDGSPAGPLRISALSAIGRHYILPALPEFTALYPGVSLELSFTDHLPDLIAEKYDLALCRGEPDNASYVGRYLCAPPMTLVASPGYLAARGIPAGVADLAGGRFVNIRLKDGSAPSWTIRERVTLATATAEPYIFQPANSLTIVEGQDCAIDAALAGLGIALVLRKSAVAPIKAGALRVVLPGHEASLSSASRIFLAYPSKKFLPARVRVFIDFLVETSAREGWSGLTAAEPASMAVPTLARVC
jgi:DNA-binding transcriptional LysR family regulator